MDSRFNYSGCCFISNGTIRLCALLWVAGMETTSNTLYWSLLYVLLNPEVCQKVYEELDMKIGSDRIITTSDRPNLNYVMATINESQRLANLLPMNLSRTTTAEVEIGGYRIPKDTVITQQISSVISSPSPMNSVHLDFGFIGKFEESRRTRTIFNWKTTMSKLHADNLSPSVEKECGVTMKAKNFRVVVKQRY